MVIARTRAPIVNLFLPLFLTTAQFQSLQKPNQFQPKTQPLVSHDLSAA